jgi:amidohydrolase
MVAGGLYDLIPRPDVVLAQHCTNGRAGRIALSPGPVKAASDSMRVTLHGRAGHAAKPHLAVDPILLAAYVLVRLQAIVSREVAPKEVAVVTCGSIHAGAVANVIPSEAQLQLNIRTYCPDTRERVLAAVRRVVEHESAASSAPPPDVQPLASVPATVNDAACTAALRAAFARHLGDVVDQAQETASDDFSVLARAADAPYVYWMIGTTEVSRWDEAERRGTLDQIPGNHSSDFAPAIQPTLRCAIDAMALAALTFLGDGGKRQTS